jgi:hypothetical protein
MNLLHFQSLSNCIFGVIFASFYNAYAYKQLFDKVGIIHVIMRKKVILQLALQVKFSIVEDICNSLYSYIVSANGQVAKLQFIVYMVPLIASQL